MHQRPLPQWRSIHNAECMEPPPPKDAADSLSQRRAAVKTVLVPTKTRSDHQARIPKTRLTMEAGQKNTMEEDQTLRDSWQRPDHLEQHVLNHATHEQHHSRDQKHLPSPGSLAHFCKFSNGETLPAILTTLSRE